MNAIVIIGAGECGTRTAFALRQQGFTGALTVVGTEPHAPYERPPLSKEIENGIVRQKTIATEEKFAAANITLKTNMTATEINCGAQSVALSDGTTLPYDTLVLATGASPRQLAMAQGQPVHYLRTIEDAQAILGDLDATHHLVILGAGFIGLELAATARLLGAKVTVIEPLPRPLARAVLPEIAAVLANRHAAEGVQILCETSITAIKGKTATLNDGNVLHPTRIVIGIGAVPNIILAQNAGLAIDNGIAVDSHLRTSDPNIYAAGDCCSFPSPINGHRIRLESWRNAQDQANHVAATIMGDEKAYAKAPWFWSDQYDLTLSVAGLPDPNQPTTKRQLSPDAFILFQFADDGRLVAASGIGIGNAVAKDIRLAERMIEAQAKPNPSDLANPETNLKQLLRG